MAEETRQSKSPNPIQTTYFEIQEQVQNDNLEVLFI